MLTIYSSIHEYMLYWNSDKANPNFTNRMRTDRLRFITRYIAPCIGTVSLNNFNEDHVYRLQTYIIDQAVPLPTQFLVLRVFRQAMNYAMSHCLINDSYCDRLYLPYILDSKVKIYSPEEINKIFGAIKHELLFNYYRLIFLTGIQSMEARALRISDIDFEENVIHIRQRIYGKSNHGHSIVPIKDNQQLRDLPMTDAIRRVLEDELARRHAKTLKPCWKDYGQDLLFVYKNGAPITDSYTRNTRILVEKLTGIKTFNTLALRYTAADIAINNGATEKDIQDLLGFTSLRYVFRMKEKLI